MSFQIFRRLILNLKPYLGRLYLAIFFSIIVGAIATSPVPLIQKTFDQIFVEKDYFMLQVIPLALVALYFCQGYLDLCPKPYYFWHFMGIGGEV